MGSLQNNNIDPKLLDEAVNFALHNESKMKRDIAAALDEGHFGEPWPIGKTIGPVKARAEPSGMILKDGQLLSSWGDVSRVDMTFSISKSYLAICTGIALDDGLIPDLNAPVRNLVDDGGFESDQNRNITWAQLLQLTSEWQGTLFEKPDWIDHNREVSGDDNGIAKGTKRVLQRNGTYWEYNDVRVNRLALALLQVFKRPIPEILKERIMDPIGASDTWQWHGYENSWVEIEGQQIQSVSGGAHWGGGLWISTQDHALVGQLMMNEGLWEGKRLLSANWIKQCTTPCRLNDQYGYLWWLNTDQKSYPGIPASSYFAIGVGTNLLWVDPKLRLVVVARWLQPECVHEFMKLVFKAFN